MRPPQPSANCVVHHVARQVSRIFENGRGTNLDKTIDSTDEKEKRGYSQTGEHELYVPRYTIRYAWWGKDYTIHARVPTRKFGILSTSSFAQGFIGVETPYEVCGDKCVHSDGGYDRRWH